MAHNEKAAMNNMFDRETQREKNLEKAIKEARVKAKKEATRKDEVRARVRAPPLRGCAFTTVLPWSVLLLRRLRAGAARRPAVAVRCVLGEGGRAGSGLALPARHTPHAAAGRSHTPSGGGQRDCGAPGEARKGVLRDHHAPTGARGGCRRGLSGWGGMTCACARYAPRRRNGPL